MNNDESAPLPPAIPQPRTVETMQLKIHGRDAEGVVTVELIDKDGRSRAFFVDADQGLSEMAEALARDDYEDRTGGEL